MESRGVSTEVAKRLPVIAQHGGLHVDLKRVGLQLRSSDDGIDPSHDALAGSIGAQQRMSEQCTVVPFFAAEVQVALQLLHRFRL